MMEKKEKTNLGSVQVHKKVLYEIVHAAIGEVDGVSWLSESMFQKAKGLLGLGKFSGIHLKVNENQDVNVEVKVFVKYGLNIPDTAKKVQDAIKAALDKTVNINLKEIDVNIQGIERGE